MAADILAAYSEIVLALILVFELEELVKPKLLSDQEIEQKVDSDKSRNSESSRELELSRQAEIQQMERNAGNILEFFS